ncbi:MAG: SET domain-containing protein-lysine N-methyltransferase [Phycisphaerae bacterium]
MIHPQTCVKYVNGQIGYGVYATAFIPKGSIVYVRDMMDCEISPRDFAAMDECYRQMAEKYSFIDEKGYRVVSWDAAKFVNHRCDFNTISAGFGFEVAVHDIQSGEEITDEYGLFNLDHDMFCCCGSRNCRKVVRGDDVARYHRKWDKIVKEALKYATRVDQPLWEYMDAVTKKSFTDYLEGTGPYVSVLSLKAVIRPQDIVVPVAEIPHVTIGEIRAEAV